MPKECDGDSIFSSVTASLLTCSGLDSPVSMSFGFAVKWFLNRLDAIVDLFARTGINRDFIRFGIVGGFGFCWDAATVYALKGIVGLYIAGTCAFLVAGTANWALNRLWTFRHLDHMAAHRQLMRFLLANSVGFIFNRGAFFILVSVSLSCRNQPILAVIAGTAAGLCFNYFLSRKFVFN